MLFAGMVCISIDFAILTRDSGWPNPRTLQTYILGSVFTFAGIAFMVGMQVVSWWYADKGPHDVIPFKPPDPDAP